MAVLRSGLRARMDEVTVNCAQRSVEHPWFGTETGFDTPSSP